MILVVAEHNNEILKSSSLNTIKAASLINEDIHVLVIGNNCDKVSKEVSEIPLVKKVLLAQSEVYEKQLVENVTPLIVKISVNYTHVLAPATAFGKNLMPRVAALLDVSQVSDIIKIESSDVFVRPIYAGNAMATVKSNDTKNVITIFKNSKIIKEHEIDKEYFLKKVRF